MPELNDNAAAARSGALDQPIAIVGMSCLFPDAPGLKDYWRLIRRGEDAIREVPESHWRLSDYFNEDPKTPDTLYCGRGGFLDPTNFDPLAFGIPPAVLEATDTAQLLGLVVGKRALDDAGYGNGRVFDRSRASVILGVTGAQELVVPLGARLGHPHWRRAMEANGIAPDVAERVMQDISAHYVGWQENSFPGLLGNVVAGRIANRLNLHGTNCVVDAACASSLGAIHMAAMELATGRADMVLTGGVDTFNDIFMFMCFARTQALSRAGDAKPFAADADGTVLGEGVGLVVLKRLADAERDGDRIHAVIRGLGTSSDGRSQSIYAPRAEGQARALRDAYNRAGVSPASVELIEAHATGTRVGDVVEFEALRTVFEEAGAARGSCAIGSVKSQIGHTKAAAGAASLIKVVLALRTKVLPPTVKISAANPRLGVEESPFHLATAARPWLASADHPRRAGVSAFGFGGSNFHAVIEEYTAGRSAAGAEEPAWDGSVEIIALSSDSPGALRLMLDECAAVCGDGAAAARFAWHSRRSFRPEHPYRLALVLERGQELGALVRAAREELNRHGVEQAWSAGNAFFGGPGEPGEIAFLFPGQGSQYVNMCRDVVCVFPEARRAIENAGEPIGNRLYPPPSFAPDALEANQAALTQTNIAQPALGAVSLALLNVLGRFGVRPHFVAGHSFGELVALHAAGCIDEAALLELARTRGALMAEAAEQGAAGDAPGAMLAVHAPLELIEAAIAEAGERGEVVIANRNTPKQGVLSGSRAAMQRLKAAFDIRGWRATWLNVSAAFHSRYMAPAYERFRAKLEHLALEPPKIPVFANATGQAYSLNPAGVRELLADQLTKPVHFLEEVRNLYAEGVRTFVEVGPKNVLTGLVRSILHDLPHHAIATDLSGGRNCGVGDIARVLAIVAVLGHAVDLKAWEHEPCEPESQNMTVQLIGANYRAARSATPPAVALPREPVTHGQANGRAQTGVIDMMQTNLGRSRDPGGAPPESAAHTAGLNGHGNGDGRNRAPGPCAAAPPAAELAVTANGDLARQALQLAQEGLRTMQVLQQQTAAAHQRFLEGQQGAQAAFARLIESQQRLLERAGGVAAAPLDAEHPTMRVPVSPAGAFATVPQPDVATPRNVALEVAPPVPIAPRVTTSRSAPAPASNHAAHDSARQPNPTQPKAETSTHASTPRDAHPSGDRTQAVLLEVVSELTGYPADMIRLDMDIEADLGIDSIKRLEILSTVQRRLPHVSAGQSQDLGSLRSLADILRHMQPEPSGGADEPGRPRDETATPAASPSGAPAQESRGATADPDAAAVLLAVVAELTGYPQDMLGLDMDIEADLGIDSIKRLEILSLVQRRRPELATIQSQDLGSLRTLGDIVRQMTGVAVQAAPPRPAPARPGKNGQGAAGVPGRDHAQAPRETRDLKSVDMTLAFERELEVERHGFLNAHVIGGRPVLPVVMMIEWLAHAAEHANPGLRVTQIRDLRVLRGVTLENGHAPRLSVHISRPRRADAVFAVEGELRSHWPDAERLNAHAALLLGDAWPTPPAPGGPPADLLWLSREQAAAAARRAYDETLFHGPLFAGIEAIQGSGLGGMLASVRPAGQPHQWMDDPPRDEWIADPLALDAALQLGVLWCAQFNGEPSLPAHVERVSLFAPAPWAGPITASLRVRDSDPQRLLADVELANQSGVLALISGCEWFVISAVRPRDAGRALPAAV